VVTPRAASAFSSGAADWQSFLDAAATEVTTEQWQAPPLRARWMRFVRAALPALPVVHELHGCGVGLCFVETLVSLLEGVGTAAAEMPDAEAASNMELALASAAPEMAAMLRRLLAHRTAGTVELALRLALAWLDVTSLQCSEQGCDAVVLALERHGMCKMIESRRSLFLGASTKLQRSSSARHAAQAAAVAHHQRGCQELLAEAPLSAARARVCHSVSARVTSLQVCAPLRAALDADPAAACLVC
jgi:hypothetical protein